MLIKWQETNNLGEIITKEDPQINVRNAHTYAKKNCRRCHGRGLELVDSGSIQVLSKGNALGINNESGEVTEHYYMDQQIINPRIYLCDCACRTLNKTGIFNYHDTQIRP